MIKEENTPKGILFITIGMSIFAIQDTLIKILSENTNLFLIYFVRSLLGITILCLYLKLTKKPIIFKTFYPLSTILRCIFFFIAFTLYYFSLSKLSLAIAITLFFVSPFFISFFSKILLNEKIGYKRWFALLIGFIGVYFVMDPNFKNFNIYTTFPIICAFFYAFTMVIQKKNNLDNVYSQTLHLYLGAILFSSIIGIVIYFYNFQNLTNPNIIFLTMKWKIDNFNILISLISIGFIGVFGFLLLFQAYRIGSPPSIAPFEYIILILALFISWFLWNETLTTKGFFGLSLIVFAGIYTFYREFKKQQRLSIDKPMIQ